MRGSELELLWPRPKVVEVGTRSATSRGSVRVECDAPGLRASVVRATERMRAARAHAPTVGTGNAIARVHVDPQLDVPPQGYRLHLAQGGIECAARDVAGARHALATLAQIVELAPDPPEMRIADAPDLLERGVLLDVSRGRVPRIETLFDLVEQLSDLKVNRLQLYCEHAFAYRGHEDVWRHASPITPDEMRALDRRCTDVGVELVPNQQSFGHMHRWLKHPRYRELAEVPAGVDHAFSLDREPYSLDLGDPAALHLLGDLYDQLLACCTSSTLNVGCDETFDLGMGKSKSACAELGVGRVYLRNLRAVHALVAERGRRMQCWGDVILQHPDLVPELPRDLATLCWGYDAGHPFARELAHFAASGLEFHVAPGTSSWQSFAGRTTNMLANVRESARAAVDAGARGLLVTDWGDRGHHQPNCVRAAGLVAAAGLAWNADAADALDAGLLARLLDAHAFRQTPAGLGRAAVELGDVYRASGSPATNGSALFFLVAFAPDVFPHPRTPDLTRDGLDAARAAITAATAHIAGAGPVQDELRLAAAACDLGAQLGLARLAAGAGVPLGGLPPRVRAELAQSFEDLAARHSAAWLRSDRPGGLAESLRWFERVIAPLRGR